MKKLAFLLAALLILSTCLVACAKDDEADEGANTPAEVVTDENGNVVAPESTSATTTAPVEKTFTFTDLEQPISVFAITALNLRAEPSFNDTVSKKAVNTGTELLKVAESTDFAVDSNNIQYKWFKVEYDGQVYYVKSTLVTAISNPDEGFVEVSKTLYATGSLKVRAVPSTENDAVGYINAGDAISIVAENTETGWYKIVFEGKYTPNGEYYVVNTAKYWSEKPAQ